MSDRMTAYADTMDAAEEQWEHLIEAIRAEGPEAHLWQTGGMCLAIGWALEGTAYAMLTTDQGPLPHVRAEARVPFTHDPDQTFPMNWTVGVYMDDEDTGETTYVTLPGDADDPDKDARIARYATAIARTIYETEKQLRTATTNAQPQEA
jgi:hypothetical protein